MAKRQDRSGSTRKCRKCGRTVDAKATKCKCGHVFAPKRADAARLAGLKQNLLAEKALLEEKMQQLQRRLEAIQVLLED